MQSIFSLETAQERDFKQGVKELLGKVIAIASPKRARTLYLNPASSPAKVSDRMIMSFLKRRAVNSSQSEFFERLHKDFWRGAAGSNFSDMCDRRFESLFLAKQGEDIEALARLWQHSPVRNIVEFGTGSGRVLNYLTRCLPDVGSVIGVDINQEQVDKNRQSDNFDERIEFACAEGAEWLESNGKPNSLFVTNGGVLGYIRREKLDRMLSHISNNLGPSMFLAIEPIAADHNWQRQKQSLPFGKELSFSHNYNDLFESNGFVVCHQRVTDFESWRMVATIARTS